MKRQSGFRLWAVVGVLLAVSCSPGAASGPVPSSPGTPVPGATQGPAPSWETVFGKDLASWKAKGWLCAVGVGQAPRYDLAVKKALFDGQVKVAAQVGGKNSTVTLEGVMPLGIPRQRTGADGVEVGMVVGFKP